MRTKARMGKCRISNLSLIARAAGSARVRSTEWLDALCPVAIPFPRFSKTQVKPLAKQIPRPGARLCAVSTRLLQGSDDARPLPKGPALC